MLAEQRRMILGVVGHASGETLAIEILIAKAQQFGMDERWRVGEFHEQPQ